ncbi:MAG: S8 family serine peptidase [Streptosporangiales bacterium]|nr:S8 family serine peptidase [Streptosporangiales bacterium]
MRPLRLGALAAAVAIPLALVSASPASADATSLVAVAKAPASTAVPGSYIVTLKSGAGMPTGVTATHRYRTVLNGFAARLSAGQLDRLRADSRVAAIEQNQVVRADETQSGATWGIDRIDQRNLPLSGTYTFTTRAANVHAYVIDTGIQTAHTEFGGRANNVFDAFGGNGQDCNGHGTHVAGTIGGSTFGVAKNVRLHGVRVLNCSGSGSNAGVIAGMDFVRNNHTDPAVANMSLGGGFSTAVNNSANALANSGVFLAVAAGNSSANACNSSPSSAANATVAAASSRTDARASFSNFGSCVDLYAPGVDVVSARLGGGSVAFSGTSMASPHVAGVGALYKATFGNASFSTVRSFLTGNATPNKITGNPSGTPNLLLFKSTL